jgi:hypothetical protein
MVTDAREPYDSVEDESEGTSYQFSLRPNQMTDLVTGSRVWFDVIEFSSWQEHRFSARIVEVMPIPIRSAGRLAGRGHR